jgi:hypothetical protein
MSKRLNWKTTGILLVILLGALVFSIIYPFYSGIQEGLGSSITSTDIKIIEDAMEEYVKEVESPGGACDTALKAIQNAKPEGTDDILLNQTIPLTISSNKESKTCAVIDKIQALNPKNKSVTNALNTCYGKKYSAALTMLNTIQDSSAMIDDSTFSTMVKNQISNPSVKGMESSYEQIKQYLDIAKQ